MIHRYAVTVAGQERAVELEPLEGRRVRVVVDGHERIVDALRLETGHWSLVEPDSGRSVTADVGGTMPQVVVSLLGLVTPAEVADARSKNLAALAHRTQSGATGPVAVRSPMPGRVVKVAVKAGDAVKGGQGVVVVEAMKMENELRAPRDGVVKAVRASEGATVESGQELVLIE